MQRPVRKLEITMLMKKSMLIRFTLLAGVVCLFTGCAAVTRTATDVGLGAGGAALGGELTKNNPYAIGEDIRLGKFAGFDLFIRAGFNNTAELVLRGRNSYGIRVTDTALGTIRSLESTAQGFEERATRLEYDIKDSQKRAVELEAKVGATFEKEERFHHLVKRQAEIEEKLDLTKNQAPAQAESAADDEVAEENSQRQTQTKTARQTRRAAVHV
jgi:hypothetical protein